MDQLNITFSFVVNTVLNFSLLQNLRAKKNRPEAVESPSSAQAPRVPSTDAPSRDRWFLRCSWRDFPPTKQIVVKRGVAKKINVVFNVRMDAQETSLIIDAAGGDTAFARLLGLDQTPGYQQRVNNWKRRGIPAQVVLDHLPSIEFLRRTARQSAERAA